MRLQCGINFDTNLKMQLKKQLRGLSALSATKAGSILQEPPTPQASRNLSKFHHSHLCTENPMTQNTIQKHFISPQMISRSTPYRSTLAIPRTDRIRCSKGARMLLRWRLELRPSSFNASNLRFTLVLSRRRTWTN